MTANPTPLYEDDDADTDLATLNRAFAGGGRFVALLDALSHDTQRNAERQPTEETA